MRGRDIKIIMQLHMYIRSKKFHYMMHEANPSFNEGMQPHEAR